MPHRKLTLLTTALLIFLAACSGGSSPSGSSGGIVPILQGIASPEDVAKQFLDNWKTANYQAMYNDLSVPSQQEYTFPVFQKIYQDAMSKIAPDQIAYVFNKTTLQGDSAAIAYDVTFTSAVFGTIADKDRTMRLVKTQNRWGVAWSSMDIVNGLVGGSQVVVKSKALPRGNIYDRNGQLLVEQNGTMIALYSARQDMVTESDCLELLAHVLKRRRYDLQKRFESYDPVTIFYLGEIDQETDTANSADLDQKCAVKRFPRDTRTYYGEGATSQLIGYIAYATQDQLNKLKAQGYREGDLVGQMGIEQLYEAALAGKPEQVLQVISPSNVVLRELGGRAGTTPQSVTLTLDKTLQMTAAQAMADAYNYAEGNWGGPTHSPGAGLVALNVKTGEVLAMVSWPFFDPSVYNGTDSPAPDEIAANVNDTRAPLRNRVVQDQYFPGSTFKIVTTAAAASEKMMTEPTFNCTLEWKGQQYGDTLPVRTDWRALESPDSDFSKPAGPVTMAQALMASCNPFFYEMGARLYTRAGANVLMNYARKMGFGVPTGIDLPETEAAGTLPNPTSVEQGINEAIGQGGVQVSILQMARMVAAVANGGTLYQPYLVEKVGGVDGQQATYTGQSKVAGQMELSEATLATIREGMCGVVSDMTYGTASFVFNGYTGNWEKYNAPYVACGKTGTAQSGRVEPYGWFVAYAPKDDPQIAVVAMVEYGREGSETAAPIVRRLLDTYFKAEQAPFPEWWNNLEYIALELKEGQTGG